MRPILAVILACAAALAAAQTPLTSAPASGPLSSAAERVYEMAKPRILQVRTLVRAAGRQTTIGSGFVVSADGYAVTNYHVVSRFALDPKAYRLEYLAPDGGKGELRLLAIDVAHDLAIVKLDHASLPYFEFEPRALAGKLPKGERIYAMGNPLDLGFIIVEGTNNGLVDKSYDERIHFSGAINPGMSGGPVTDSEGRIVGVNVAKRLDGEQVGFLVPARFAAALVERARTGAPLAVDKAREEVGRQLDAWQAGFYRQLAEEGFREATFGNYRGLESDARWMTCWAATNADQVPKPRASIDTTRCTSGAGLFVSDRILTGRVDVTYSYHRAIDLNAFQFAHELAQHAAGGGNDAGRRLTAQSCSDGFVRDPAGARPVLRATWCMRAYREFAGLYNVTLLVATQDRDREALLAQLAMQGVSESNALALGRRFIEGIRWAP